MFSVHSAPETFENETIAGQFGFKLEENPVREVTWLPWRHHFRKPPFSKCFLSTRKRKAGVVGVFRFEELWRKTPFSRRISVDSRPNPRRLPRRLWAKLWSAAVHFSDALYMYDIPKRKLTRLSWYCMCNLPMTRGPSSGPATFPLWRQEKKGPKIRIQRHNLQWI